MISNWRVLSAGAPGLNLGRSHQHHAIQQIRDVRSSSFFPCVLFSGKHPHGVVDERCARPRSTAQRISPVAALAAGRRPSLSSSPVFLAGSVHAAACPVVAAPHDGDRSSCDGNCSSGVRLFQLAAPVSPIPWRHCRHSLKLVTAHRLQLPRTPVAAPLDAYSSFPLSTVAARRSSRGSHGLRI